MSYHESMGTFKDITGQTFNRLTALHRLPAIKPRAMVRWLFQCSCGKQCVAVGAAVVRGNLKSCGCLRNEKFRSRVTTHGRSGSQEYIAWCGMKRRCTAKDSRDYPRYGGRGITYDQRWETFEQFLADMGEMPGPRYSLGRIDNDAGYCPANCRWETPTQQIRNRNVTIRITAYGITMSLPDWAERTGLQYMTLWVRYQNGDRGEHLLRPSKRGTRRERTPTSLMPCG